MSSVMQANLLLTKTVIAGDSWGEIAVPVIQEHPATAIIFIGSLLTLVFGVLNIIVAVVVDTFADARQNDLQNLAEEMEDEIEHDRKALAKLFAKIDKDNSGQLTLQELIEGARQDPGFQSRLRVMDIDENDLHQLFQMIDMDRSGTIEVAEFIGPLSRWAHDSKTAPRFIKYNMLQTMHLQEDLYALSEDCFENLAKRVDDLALQISALGKIGYGTRQNESRPESRHESKLRGPAGLPGGPGPSNPSNPSPSTPLTCVGSDGILSSNLGLWTRHATEEVASTKSTQQEADQVDQPRTSTVGEFLSPKTSKAEKNHMNDLDLLESLLESSMAKLESKLDVLLDRSRMKVPEVGLGSEDVESWKGGPGLRSRRKAPMLHPEAFRSMYINRRQRISLASLDSSALRPSAPHDPRRRTSEADAPTRSFQFGTLPVSGSSSLHDEQNQVHLAPRPSIELSKDL